MFNIQQSIIWPALRWQKGFKILQGLITFCLIIVFLLLVFLIFPLAVLSVRQVLGLVIIFLITSLNFKIALFFYKDYLQRPALKIALAAVKNPLINLADFLSFESALLVAKTQQRARKQKIGFLSSLIAELVDDSGVNLTFKRAGLLIDDFKGYLDVDSEKEPDLLSLVQRSKETAIFKKHQCIQVGDLLAALAYLSPIFLEVLINKNLDYRDFFQIILWAERTKTQEQRQKHFWHKENLGLGSGIGKTWTSGWTYYLDKYVFDITKAIGQGTRVPQLISRPQALDLLEAALSGSRQNNVLLVGEPGVGKKTVVYNLAQKILLNEVMPALKYSRVLELDVDLLLTKQDDKTIETRFKQILQEAASAGNVILFIDQIHRILGDKLGLGRADLSLILLPYLEGTELQLIGTIDYEKYHQDIEKRGDLRKVFEKIEINPPTQDETILIIEDLVSSFERRYEIYITYQAIKAVVNLADRYIQDVPFPEKAIDVLEAGLILAHKLGDQILSTEHIEKAVFQQTEVPVGEARALEKERLLKLETLIHRRVINQEQAVKQVASAMRRSRAGVTGYQRPIGTFLFLGPTGVGKTETAKALAEVYFGSEKRMIRLDMSEYQQISDLDKFLGSADSQIEGQLTSRLREDPFSLVLLDEIEKAHPKILHLFLQVLDEGRLTDAQGRGVSFLSSIIIATSNAAAEFIRQHVLADTASPVIARSDPQLDQRERRGNPVLNNKKEGLDFKKELLEYLQSQGIFAPEFLNRFDAVVVFGPLNKEHLRVIAKLMLDKLSQGVLAERGIEITFAQDTIDKIVHFGYDPQFGARPMRRVIQDRIEDKLAQKILSGDLQRGAKIYLTAKDV